MVPDVNWMFTISPADRGESGVMVWPDWVEKREVKGVVAENEEVSTREDELSTRNIFRRDGTLADSTFFAERSGAICRRRVMFSLGGLYGRFVSVPMIKCAASKCESAAITCGELKAGFKGTYIKKPLVSRIPLVLPVGSSTDTITNSIPDIERLTKIAPSLNKL